VKHLAAGIGLILFAVRAFTADVPPQQFGDLGDFRLDSGEVIRGCRIGYRRAGELPAGKSNVIVVTTWFGGNSSGLLGMIGDRDFFDTSKYHVIVIDALGDGVSSSPSNSTAQPRQKFPHFTIRDMVRSQHELLTRVLHIDHVYAVAGLSMGGMQVFQWIASYPEFMQKAVAIAGTPKQTAQDIILWRTQLDLLAATRGSRDAMSAVAGMNELELRTPAWIAKNVTDPDKTLEEHRRSMDRLDPFDYMSQLRAMIAHDITTDFHPPLKPKMLIAVALQDHMVNPGPAREFARANGVALVVLSGDCGHLATLCERDVLMREVAAFLKDEG
jgi:homoserine O-acetyltransferase